MTIAPKRIPGPKEPDVVRVLREFREAMDASEMALMQRMADTWMTVEQGLMADMTLLAIEAARRLESGQAVTQQMVWKMERYKIVKGQMEAQIRRYNENYAAPLIAGAQREYSMLGMQAAADALTVTLGPTGRYFTRINVGAVEAMIGFAGNGAPLRRLLEADYGDAAIGMMQALIQGLTRGQGANQIARQMADGLGMGLERAILIARTEAARAYRMGSAEQYRQSGVVVGFRRLVKKVTACMACLALDGQKFETKDELTDHPAGKCTAIPDVEGVRPVRWQTGLTWFKTLTAGEQRSRLGPERYQLWQDGKIKLEDLARFSHSDEWGDSPRVATVRELIGE